MDAVTFEKDITFREKVQAIFSACLLFGIIGIFKISDFLDLKEK